MADTTRTAEGSITPTGEVRRGRRSRRDWVVDSVTFLLAVLVGLLFLVVAAAPVEDMGIVALTPVTAVLDVVLGALACVALWWRRRSPVTLALLVTATSVVSTTSAGALAVLVFTVAAAASTLVVLLQLRLMEVAGDAQMLGAALNHSSLNAANALGAWIGGLVIAAGWGYTAPSLVGAGLAVLGLGVLAVSAVLRRRELRAL